MNKPPKPMNCRAYGHIPHLPGSKTGPADHTINDGQANILTLRTRDDHDLVIVTEKLDGSCCAVANVDGNIIPLTRAGYHARTSKYEQHHMFADWVEFHVRRNRFKLQPGCRIVGEWLAQAHGTRYELVHEPFAPFDVFTPDNERMPHYDAQDAIHRCDLIGATVLHVGGALSIPDALAALGNNGHHGAQDFAEGVVYRMERDGRVDFLAKYVRETANPGQYLPEISGHSAVWNWRPKASEPIHARCHPPAMHADGRPPVMRGRPPKPRGNEVRMSVAQIAGRYNVSKSMILRLIRRGVLPVYKLGQKTIRLDPVEVDEILRRLNEETC